ncbi:Uncharacterised protein [Mycobacteroides abscessus subsp. abscessus]|nr:Uncharacterised protein [Mycobacteroides abscessus subsp. abscessus]
MRCRMPVRPPPEHTSGRNPAAKSLLTVRLAADPVISRSTAADDPGECLAILARDS